MRRTMIGLVLAGGFVASSPGKASDAPARHPVAPQGETHITAGTVVIDLTTRAATPAENVPNRATRCTGGWTACSLVDALSIRVHGKRVPIPDRLPLLLADVSTASVIRIAPERYRLTLSGGDAAAGYEARIYFDRHMVHHMEIWSGEMHLLEQVTVYHDMASKILAG